MITNRYFSVIPGEMVDLQSKFFGRRPHFLDDFSVLCYAGCNADVFTIMRCVRNDMQLFCLKHVEVESCITVKLPFLLYLNITSDITTATGFAG